MKKNLLRISICFAFILFIIGLNAKTFKASFFDEEVTEVAMRANEELKVIETGKCGDNVIYTLYSNGHLVISGSGPMMDYAYNTCLFSYNENITSLTIESGVTTIGKYAFYYCTGLISISIGNDVEKINSYAFQGCTKLKNLTIGNKVTSIDERAFYGCGSLMFLEIPDSVSIIGSYSFGSCYSLISVTLGKSLESIGSSAFDFCYKILEVINMSNINITRGYINNGYVAYHAYSVVKDKSLSNLQIDEDGFVSIMNYNGKHILGGYIGNKTDIVIPEYIGELSGYCFYNLSNLTSITIPDSVTSIGSSAFSNCSSLTSITIPDNVTSIGSSAFYKCSSLTSITIPDNVTSIGSSAFSNCSSLTSITIPNRVRSIADETFYNCSSLTSIKIPDSVTSIGSKAFYNCSSLTSITIPDNVTSIGSSVFYNCSSLTSITIPDNVTSIGSSVFHSCSSLTSITIPDNVTSIGSYAFYNCSSLTSITIPDNVTSIGSYAFYNCSSLTSITIPNRVTSIDNYTFSSCSKLTSVTLGNSVTGIGGFAFSSCRNLTSITIPEGVKSIGNSAFSNCSKLTSVTLGNSVTSIGGSAFFNCSSLTSITIPDNVTRIGGSAFHSCSSLTSITIPDNVTSIGSYAFCYCSSLTSITIPDNVTSIEENVFSNCTSLISVKLGNKLEGIGPEDFKGCYNLLSICIPSNITYIGSNAFSGCYKLVEIINESSLSISKYNYNGSYHYNGSLGIYSLNITNNKNLSKLRIDDNGFATIEIDGNNILVSYIGSDNDVIIPENIDAINSYAFYKNYELKSITIPDSVTKIENDAFRECNNLTNLNLGNGVTNIGDSAFYGCQSLTSVTIPNSVKNIDSNAFSGCFRLVEIINKSKIYITSGTTYNGSIGYNAISIINDESKSTLNTDNNGFITIDNNGVKTLVDYIGTDTEITIPSDVKVINHCAFYNRSSLTSITIPEGVTSIGNSAFIGCSSLTSITIPEGVTSIGVYTFDNCNNLENLVVPASISRIVNQFGNAFIKNIYFYNPELYISDSTFTLWSQTIIHGYPGSTAEAYATKYNRTFVPIIDNVLDHYEEVPATCTTSGMKEYYTDGVKYYLDENGNNEVSFSSLIINALDHDYSNITYTWNNDSATAKAVCQHDNTHIITETVKATYVSEITPTCLEKGYGHYEVSFTNELFKNQSTTSRSVEKDALSHNYGEVVYSWDGEFCTATRVCSNDEEHVETETVKGDYKVKNAATCTTNEEGYYEAKFVNSAFVNQNSDSFEKEGSSLGHDINREFYEVIIDEDACFVFRCQRDNCDHYEEYLADYERDEGNSYPATCTSKGKVVVRLFVIIDGVEYLKNIEESIDQLVHYTTDLLQYQAPTCDSDGYKYFGCSNCKVISRKEIIPKSGHSFTSTTFSGNCGDDVVTTYTCSCGYSYSEHSIREHNYEFDRIENGDIVLVCSYCGGKTTETDLNSLLYAQYANPTVSLYKHGVPVRVLANGLSFSMLKSSIKVIDLTLKIKDAEAKISKPDSAYEVGFDLEANNDCYLVRLDEYKSGNKYQLKLSNGVKFKDYVGDILTIVIERYKDTQNSEPDFRFSDDILFLQCFDPMYGNTSIELDAANDLYHITCSYVDFFNNREDYIGRTLCYGIYKNIDELHMIELSGEIVDSSTIFGEIVDIYMTNNIVHLILKAPNIETVFSTLNVSNNVFKNFDVNNLGIDSDRLGIAFLNSESYLSFEKLFALAVEKFINKELKDFDLIKDEDDKISVGENPKVEITDLKVEDNQLIFEANISYAIKKDIKYRDKHTGLKSDLGSIGAKLNDKIRIVLSADAAVESDYSIFGVHLAVDIVQTTTNDFNFEVYIDLNVELGEVNAEPVIINTESKLIHSPNCHYPAVTDDSKTETISRDLVSFRSILPVTVTGGYEFHPSYTVDFGDEKYFSYRECLYCCPISRSVTQYFTVTNLNTQTVHIFTCPVLKRCSNVSQISYSTELPDSAVACNHCHPDQVKSTKQFAVLQGCIAEASFDQAKKDQSLDMGKSKSGYTLFNTDIPIAAVAGINVEIKLVFNFNLKGSISLHNEVETVENFHIDAYLTHREVTHSNIKSSSKTIAEAKINAEVKVGVALSARVTVTGLGQFFGAGVKAEIGAYATLSGLMHFDDNKGDKDDKDDTNFYFAGYLETGLYFNVSISVKIIFEKDFKLVDKKYPLLMIGYDKVYYKFNEESEAYEFISGKELNTDIVSKYKYFDLKTMKDGMESIPLDTRKLNVSIDFIIKTPGDEPLELFNFNSWSNTSFAKFDAKTKTYYYMIYEEGKLQISASRDGKLLHNFQVILEIKLSTKSNVVTTPDEFYGDKKQKKNELAQVPKNKEVVLNVAYHTMELLETKINDCENDGYKLYGCKYCDYIEREEKAALGHHKILYEEKLDPTCTENGHEESLICTRCQKIFGGETIRKLGHDTSTTDSATCTKDGYKVTTCSRCDYHVSEASPAKGHKLTTTDSATCTEDGRIVTTCSRCDYYHSENSSAKGHKLRTVTINATCTKDGSSTTKCSVCSYSETTIIKSDGHDWEAFYTIDVKASCAKDGSKSIHCKNCSSKKNVTTIPKDGHDFSGNYVTDVYPTCHSYGSESIHCAICGAHGYESQISMLDHAWDTEYKEDKKATCTEEGSKSIHCHNAGCKQTKNEVKIDALGHDYVYKFVDATCTSTGHTEECSRCHQANPATTIALKEHIVSPVKHVVVQATCISLGVQQDYCSVCKAVLDEYYTDTVDHNYIASYKAPTCEEYGHKKVCSYCREPEYETRIKPLGHDYELIEQVAPTCSDFGYGYYKCKNCDDTYRSSRAKNEHILNNDYTCINCGEHEYTHKVHMNEIDFYIVDIDGVTTLDIRRFEYSGSEEYIFNYINLEKIREVIISNDVKYLPNGFFYNFDNVRKIITPAVYESLDGLFTKIVKKKVLFFTKTEKKINTPSLLSLTITDGTFNEEKAANSGYVYGLQLQDGVKISDNAIAKSGAKHLEFDGYIYNLGINSFNGVTKIKTLKMVKSNANRLFIDYYDSFFSELTSLHAIVSTDNYAFDITNLPIRNVSTFEGITLHTYSDHQHNWKIDSTLCKDRVECEKDGYICYYCTICSDFYFNTYEYIPTSCHSFVIYGSKNATCTEDGHTSYRICRYCSYTEGYEVIECSGHKIQNIVITQPTCETAGEGKKYCTVCKEDFETYTIDQLGHIELGLREVSSTCTTTGYKKFYCPICEKDFNIETPVKEHNASIEYCWSNDHRYCSVKATCVDCGNIETRITVEATITIDGNHNIIYADFGDIHYENQVFDFVMIQPNTDNVLVDEQQTVVDAGESSNNKDTNIRIGQSIIDNSKQKDLVVKASQATIRFGSSTVAKMSEKESSIDVIVEVNESSADILLAKKVINISVFAGEEYLLSKDTAATNGSIIITVPYTKSLNVKDIAVYYNGQELEIADYNPSTGELSFVTTHFSTFFIENNSDEECMSTILDNNFKCSLSYSGILTISGNGVLTSLIQIEEFKPYVKKIVLEEGITSLEDASIYGFDNLVEIVIPKSLTNANLFGVYNCDNLDTIYYLGNTIEEWNNVNIGEENNLYSTNNFYLYTEDYDNNDNQYWTYVDGEVAYTKKNLIINKVSLSLENNLQINFKALVNSFDGLDSYVLEVNQNGEISYINALPETQIIDGKEYAIFKVTNFIAARISEDLNVRLVGRVGHTIYTGANLKYGIKTYCMNKINSSSTSLELKKLCINILKYGALAQQYFDVNVDDLADKDLTSEQLALVENDEVPFRDSMSLDDQPINELVSIRKVNLSLKDNISMNIKFLADSLDGIVLKVWKDLNNNEVEDSGEVKYIDASTYKFGTEIISGLEYYVYTIDDLDASQLRTKVYIKFFKADEVVSGYLRYSVESYTARESDKNSKVKDLAIQILKYSDSAKIYLESKGAN